MKTLIVVSGGDAPGINAVIAGYTALAIRKGDSVLGAQGGFAGVLANQIQLIDLPVVRLLSGRGGSYLQSSREPVLGRPDVEEQLKAILHHNEIDNLLLFGGDGTLRHVLPLLEEWGIPAIALPTTIDNDVPGTDMTLGHDSACNYAYQAIDGSLATAHALPGRIFMVETLGGETGYLAQAIAYGSGAQMVLVPEYPEALEWVGERLKAVLVTDGYALAVLSEGVQTIPQMAEAIPRLTGTRLRYIALGHAQRGVNISHRDRTLAVEMSQLAYQGFLGGVKTGTVIVQNGRTELVSELLDSTPKPPPDRSQYDFINLR
ncbi:MAG: 6-phosphofructokinase [Chloroflexota bacterium]